MIVLGICATIYLSCSSVFSVSRIKRKKDRNQSVLEKLEIYQKEVK